MAESDLLQNSSLDEGLPIGATQYGMCQIGLQMLSNVVILLPIQFGNKNVISLTWQTLWQRGPGFLRCPCQVRTRELAAVCILHSVQNLQ